MIRTSPLRRLATTISAGLAGQAGLAISGIFVARMLGAENRGHLALLMLVPLVIVVLGCGGFPIALTYGIARDIQAAGSLVRAVLRPVAVQWGALVLIHWAIVLWIAWTASPTVRTAALETLPLSVGLLAQIYGLAVLQGQQRFHAFNILRTVPSAAYAAAVLALFVADQGTLPNAALAWSAISVVAGGATLLIALRGLPDAHDEQLSVRQLALFGAKALLGSNSPIETFQVDQLLVGIFLSPIALGFYVVGLAFTNLPRLASQSIGMVAYPDVASRPDPAAARHVTWRYVGMTALIAGAVCLFLAGIAGWLLPVLVGDQFRPAVTVARIMLVGAFFLSIRRVLADCANGAGNPAAGTIAEIGAWLVFAASAAVLLPVFGVDGVAVAVAVSATANLAILALLVASPDAWSLRARGLVGRPAQ